MTYRDIFTRLRSDLGKFNPNELIIVTYDEMKHTLQFSQLNQVMIASYLSPYFLPKKGFKMGVLTQHGLNRLLYGLDTLLGNHLIDNLDYIPNLMPLCTEWYRYYGADNPVPEIAIKLKYVNVTSKFYTWFLCTRFNSASKTLYKVLNKAKK